MWPLLGGALLAGLLGSPHCVGMCGGFAGACATTRTGAGGYHLGRLTTYGVLGAVVGGLGSAIPGPGWIGTALAATLTLAFAASLAGLIPAVPVQVPGITRAAVWLGQRDGVLPRYAFGAVTALLPCGLVYSALGMAVAAGSAPWGAVVMVVFGAGTIPLLATAAVGLRRITANSLWARRGLAVLVLVAGWWSIAVRQGLLELEALGAAGSEPTAPAVLSDTDPPGE